MVYYTEESDSIDMTSKAAVADERAKGKKRDVISLFQSKSALKNKAGKLSAKQEEADIKSTGSRNDYMLSLETANAHVLARVLATSHGGVCRRSQSTITLICEIHRSQ